MSDFKSFKTAVEQKINAMMKGEKPLFVVDYDKTEFWELYLNSFPAGTNEIFRERREYDCNCCKQFIRSVGAIVTIDDNLQYQTVWDVEVEHPFKEVTVALNAYIRSKPIRDVFFSSERTAGQDFNYDNLTNRKWEHFYVSIPSSRIQSKTNIGSKIGDLRETKNVFKRGLETITDDAVQTVLELIEQGSLYKGPEFKKVVADFSTQKNAYSKIVGDNEKDNFCWYMAATKGHSLRVRNTVIGTLLVAISEGEELDTAVRSYEQKTAPTNYKRPTALVTQSMVKEAQKTVDALGIESSLQRRYASESDITVNNVLFVDRSVKKAMSIFDQMNEEAGKTKPANFSKVEEITAEKFVKDVLPRCEEVEVMFENRHTNNLMTLIAPTDPEAKGIMKWNNNFSWSYVGEVTDSIKERVKQAGGNVEGVIRVSLSWYNYDDLDLHIEEPKHHIYFGSKRSPSSGHLDVDMNAGTGRSRKPVENVIWTDRNKIHEGVYEVSVKQFSKRETSNVGFEVEIEYEGQKWNYVYDKAVSGVIKVCSFKWSKQTGFEMVSSIPSTKTTKQIWNVNTEQFNKVKMIMNSPNHWDGQTIGNKHLFFIMDKCYNPENSRGFYNEFLSDELTKHRKVFEVLGNKLRVEHSKDQLSGIGFSESKRDEVLVRVKGAVNRLLKVKF